MSAQPAPYAPLLPVLMPPNWEGAKTYRCRRIYFPGAGDEGDLPWLALAYDSGGSEPLAFVGKEDTGPGFDEQEAAIENLAAIPVEWRLEVIGGVAAAVARGRWVAEHVVFPEFLAHAAEMLHAPALTVAFPSRGVLIAIDSQVGATAQSWFAAQMEQVYKDAPDPITPLVWLWQDGAFTRVADAQGSHLSFEENLAYVRLGVAAAAVLVPLLLLGYFWVESLLY